MNDNGPVKQVLIVIILFLCLLPATGQEITISTGDTSLNKLLVDLRDRYGIELSFSDSDLSDYTVSINGTFDSFEQLLNLILEGKPFEYSKSGNTYIIFRSKTRRQPEFFAVSGRVTDRYSGESLPFSHVGINGQWTVTDFKGNFSYLSAEDSLINLTVSYLGYYIIDTLVYPGVDIEIGLIPSNIEIEEVVIMGSVIERSITKGNTPGEMRLNHQVTEYLPGNGDNSVFNLLRLQPGILASGEQSNDMVIWGSYEGQSQVRFDGFTLFGLKNFNDNISAVNPFMAKDIRVLKGGYGSEYGERVGGIVDITGIDGDRYDPHLKLSINNLTLNGTASVPLYKEASVVLAFRQTYYDLYKATNLSLASTRSHNPGSTVDLNIFPDYQFRDLNMKISGRTGKGDSYYLSFLTGRDDFSYSAEDQTLNRYLLNESDEKNIQTGLSGFYGKVWKNGAVSNFTFSYSGLDNESHQVKKVERRMGNNQVIFNTEEDIFSTVGESHIKSDNIFNLGRVQSVETGLGLINDRVTFKEDTFGIEQISDRSELWLPYAYISDRISLGNLVLKAGARLNVPVNNPKPYFQPRISARYNIGSHLNISGAWGLYNQYISKSVILDEGGNYYYQWAVGDNGTIPVLRSRHIVGSINYSHGGFQLGVEGWSKKTDGLTRFIKTRFTRELYSGDAKGKGIDFFARTDFRGHTFWLSYSLSETLEWFPYMPGSEYMPALQDQRHEVKAAGILNLDPIYFSANYVYGSGFPVAVQYLPTDELTPAYSRLDIAAVYKFRRSRYGFDAGLSVMNLLNTENIKVDNFVSIPSGPSEFVDLYAEAVPRTLTIFLNIEF